MFNLISSAAGDIGRDHFQVVASTIRGLQTLLG
jgi:hypothetical protein